MAVELSISIKQNSQNVANNTSNVTVSVIASWTGGSYNRLEKSGWLKLDGTTYTFTSSFNYYAVTSGSETIYSKTVNVSHDSNGAKTLSCLASYTTGVSSGTITASASKTLTTIPRKSTVSAPAGTLGTAQTLTVTRKSSSFTHTITYACNSASGTICTKSSSTSISWTPPLSLANQNTTGTSVSIKFTITTYSGSTNVGSYTTSAITYSIPSNVKPSCTVTVTDPTGYADKYGGFVKGISKFKVVVTPTTSYGSPISSYSTTANGSTYTSASFTTDVLSSNGSQTVTATVKDSRGRSGSTSVTKTVLDYSSPVITRLAVHRCDSDGTENDQGAYIQVSFAAAVTSLNNKNTASYALKYKRSSSSSYTYVSLEEHTGIYSLTASHIFSADSGSSYDIEFIATDNHTSTHRTTSASTAFTLMNWNAKGNGIAFGKVSELENVLDVGFQTRLLGGIKHPVLEPETDLDHVLIPNTYIGDNVSTYNYANCPVESGTFTLIVESGGDSGQVRQTYLTCSKYKPQRFVRFYYQSSWGPWMFGTTEEVVLYENASGSNGTLALTFSVEHFRYIEIYYTDNNGKGGGYTKVWNPNGKTITLQMQEPGTNVYIRQTDYRISGTSMTPNVTTAGYVELKGTGTLSVVSEANYIKIVRVIGLA